jgi:predicted ATPase
MSAIRTPLRGRDGQLSLIRDQLDRAVAGRGAMVLVEGRPGFGKTRLLDEIAEFALGRGIRVGRGSVTVSDQRVPLAVLNEALFDGAQPLLDRNERARSHHLPEQRYLLLDELESLLERAAMRSPLLICGRVCCRG